MGRPTTVEGPVTSIRLPPKLASAVDAWAERNAAKSRSDAIRCLIEQALAHAPHRARPKAESLKASALARRELERATEDDGAHPEEQERRKRRLLKGPPEFREMRGDGGRRIKGK
jgi:metal-responsive CopG/Arc/MetJ family transcriptional regulator